MLPRSFTKIRHYGFLANHRRRRTIPQARAAIARRRCHVLRYHPPPACAPWQPACPHCGGTRLLCVALIQPDGCTIVLPAAARLSALRPRAPGSPLFSEAVCRRYHFSGTRRRSAPIERDNNALAAGDTRHIMHHRPPLLHGPSFRR